VPSQQFAEHWKPEQPPQLPHDPQPQLPLHVRERSLLPDGQLPQLVLPVSTLPGAQPLSPAQPPHGPQAPQPQLALQARVRVCVPLAQLPQACEADSV
jgi:hypothetical protein